MPAAAIYARISSDHRGDAAGVKRQIEDCKKLAAQRDLKVADLYVDNDISAYSGKPRPEYRRLCEDIKGGLINVVIAWHPDRLHRSTKELEEFIDLLDASGTDVQTCVGGHYDLSTASGKMMARIVGAVARGDSEHASERIKRKMAERAQQGKAPAGGARPYGYERGRTGIVESEAAVVREAAKRVLAGEALYSVCTDFNERGLTTSTGRPWTTSALRRTLQSGHISGQREYHGEIVGPAQWPAIISPSETARLKTLFSDPARRTKRAARTYPLHGLLYCGVCGAALLSRPRGDGRRLYGCMSGTNFHGCGKIRVVAEPVETLIQEAILIRLDTTELQRLVLGEAAQGTQAAALQRELADMTADLENLASAHGRGEISWVEFLAARKAFTERIDAAKAKLSRLSRHSALAGFVGNSEELRSQWASLPLTRQRAIVEALADRITISPANKRNPRFDPGRVTVTWRA